MDQAIIKAAAAIGAGLCMGLGAIGPAVGEGNAVGKASRAWHVSRRSPTRCVPT